MRISISRETKENKTESCIITLAKQRQTSNTEGITPHTNCAHTKLRYTLDQNRLANKIQIGKPVPRAPRAHTDTNSRKTSEQRSSREATE